MNIRFLWLTLAVFRLLASTVLTSEVNAGESTSPSKMILELRDASRLVGTVSLTALPVQTSFAKIDVPMSLIETVEFKEDRVTGVIVCANGDRLEGTIRLEAIAIKTAFDKTSIPLKDIVRISKERGAEQETKETEEPPAATEQTVPLQFAIELRDGSRLIGRPSITSLPVQTSFGKIELPLKLVERVEFKEDREKVVVSCRNGDQVEGILGLTAVVVNTTFDKVSVKIDQVRAISTVTGSSLRGLVLYYAFDKDEGDKVTDKSGHGNDGKVRGAIWSRNGKVGGAMSFDGQASIDLGNLHAVENQYSLSWGAWVYPTGSGLYGIMGKTESGNEVFYLCSFPERSGFNCYVVPRGRSEERSAHGEGMLERNKWQHLMGTYDGRQVKAYYNGRLIDSSPLYERKPTNSNSTSAAIGDTSYGRGWRFQGKIDEVMIFDRTLSAAEISQLYNSQKTSR